MVTANRTRWAGFANLKKNGALLAELYRGILQPSDLGRVIANAGDDPTDPALLFAVLEHPDLSPPDAP